MVDMTKKIANKLMSVNVPELFVQQFITPMEMTADQNSVVKLIMNTSPTPRGRGMSRVVKNVSEEQWNELYAYAAKARAAICGADRETELKPAICGKSLANRMETLGVANPVAWSPSKSSGPRKPKTEVPTVADNDGNTDAMDSLPSNPINLNTAEDVNEVTGDELNHLHNDVKQFLS